MKESPIPAEQLPTHVAIIMDGNGRWAESMGMPRMAGHEAGAKTVKEIVQRCAELEIKYLTLYSFSTENWNRPDAEVNALMELLLERLSLEVPQLIENRIRLVHYGSRERLSPEVLNALDASCKATAGGDRLTVGLALDYSGRSELITAIRRIVSDGIPVDLINQQTIDDRLYTAGTPDPDLIIRTAGEYRISNFLLWQIAYAEIHVVQQCWPEFTNDIFDAAMVEYASRNRRYGKVK